MVSFHLWRLSVRMFILLQSYFLLWQIEFLISKQFTSSSCPLCFFVSYLEKGRGMAASLLQLFFFFFLPLILVLLPTVVFFISNLVFFFFPFHHFPAFLFLLIIFLNVVSKSWCKQSKRISEIEDKCSRQRERKRKRETEKTKTEKGKELGERIQNCFIKGSFLGASLG